MEISLENLFLNIGALSVKRNLLYISLRAQNREKGVGERSEQKKNKQTKSTDKKSKLKIHNREHTFKEKNTESFIFSYNLFLDFKNC